MSEPDKYDLYEACRWYCSKMLCQLIAQCTTDDVNKVASDMTGETPIFAACRRRGPIRIIKALIQKGADLNYKNRFDETPLFTAMHLGNTRVFHLLLKHGANVNVRVRQYDRSLLHYAVFFKRSWAFLTMILNENIQYDAFVNVNHCDTFGQTPLSLAIEANRSTEANLLLRHGADPNIGLCRYQVPQDKTYRYVTPLHYAFYCRDPERVHLLVKNGYNLARQDRGALFTALGTFGMTKLYRKLFPNAFSPGSLVTDGGDMEMTPLAFAASHGRHLVVVLLLSFGVDVLETFNGKTALDHLEIAYLENHHLQVTYRHIRKDLHDAIEKQRCLFLSKLKCLCEQRSVQMIDPHPDGILNHVMNMNNDVFSEMTEFLYK
jgi:ankyrin repeat protein